MKKRRIAIDLVPIIPGKGGTGSGIWTYARELVCHLNRRAPTDDLEIVCLLSRQHLAAFSMDWKMRPVVFPSIEKNKWLRLLWVHFVLPLWCFFNHADVLHKLATETPLLCSARRVTTVHDFFYEFMAEHFQTRPTPAARYFFRITRVCFQKSVHVITDSRAVMNEALRRFPEAVGRISSIPIGAVPPAADAVCASSAAHPVILCVAKFMPYKGQCEALDAFIVLHKNYPEARLILHGFSNDEAYRRLLEERIRQEQLTAQVALRQYTADGTLDELYAGAGALLFLSAYEGFGLPLIEAQQRGVPVVCSNIPVMREVAGEAALFVDRADPVAVASALAQVLFDAGQRSVLIRQGHENAATYDWNRTAEQTMQIYSRVANGARC